MQGVTMKVLRILFFMALCLMGFATHSEEVTYTVKAGDTLSKIALVFRTSVDTLVETNSIGNRNLIYPKQKLSINISERSMVANSEKRAASNHVVAAHLYQEANIAKILNEQASGSMAVIETSLYRCTVRSSGSPHCEEKAVLGQHEQVISVANETPTNSLPLGVPRDAQAETLIDPTDIDTSSAISFSVVKELFPWPTNDARTKRRASIRKFLRTYLGPPYDLARMENVLLNASFPSRNQSKGESED